MEDSLLTCRVQLPGTDIVHSLTQRNQRIRGTEQEPVLQHSGRCQTVVLTAGTEAME